MKILFLLSMILFSWDSYSHSNATALRRSNGLLRFIAEHEGIRNTALSSLIGTRCSRYVDSEQRGPCKEAVKKMIQLLDFDVIFAQEIHSTHVDREWSPKSFVFVAFKQKLIKLLEDPKTKSYLLHLNEELYRFLLEGKEKVNIWALTKKFYATDLEASEAIAVLFQDTSRMKLHLAYLEHMRPKSGEIYEQNLELVARVIEAINLILDTSEEYYRQLFYPEEIQKHLNRNIYHFYVPLYLSRALHQQGLKSDYAYKSTLMLTLTYEFVTTSKGYENIYFDPKTIEDKNDLQDIYGGHCGSVLGAFGAHRYQSYKDVQDSFQRSTTDGVELLLKVKQTVAEKLSRR